MCIQLWTSVLHVSSFFFPSFFNDPPTTEIYTLSLHDALPILRPPDSAWCKLTMLSSDTIVLCSERGNLHAILQGINYRCGCWLLIQPGDRKSTRLNSSHMSISYAVFCLKKKN